jgi:hypothetical protein
MDLDLYICHCPEDEEAAGMVCAALEASGLRCFLNPRDVDPQADRPSQLASAIAASAFFVLVYSKQAAAWRPMRRELETAMAGNATGYLVRLDGTTPDSQMRQAIARQRWFQASDVLGENNLLVRRIFSENSAGGSSALPDDKKRFLIAGALVLLLLVVVGAGVALTLGQILNARFPGARPVPPPVVRTPPQTIPVPRTLPRLPAAAARKALPFHSPAGDFEVTAPVALRPLPVEYMVLPTGRLAMYQFDGLDEPNNLYYMAMYIVIPPGQAFSLDGAVRGMAAGGRLTRIADDSLDGVPGKQFTLIKSSQSIQGTFDGRIFLLNNHVIGVMVGTAATGRGAMSGFGGMSSPEGRAFVQSLKLLSLPPVAASKAAGVEFRYPGSFAVTAPVSLKEIPTTLMELPNGAGKTYLHQVEGTDEASHVVYIAHTYLYPASDTNRSLDDILKMMVGDSTLKNVSAITQGGHAGVAFTIIPSTGTDRLAISGRIFLTNFRIVCAMVKWPMGNESETPAPQTVKFLDSLRFVSPTAVP